MLGMLAAVALLATDAKPSCGLSNLNLCRNVNHLMSPEFAVAVRQFIGPGRASLLYPGSLADQQMDVLGGPPDDAMRVGDLYRFSACRRHSCPEKGAVLLDSSGKIVATAILYSRFYDRPQPEDWSDLDALNVYVSDPAKARALVEHLIAWAKAVELADQADYGSKRRLNSVRLYVVGKGAPKSLPSSELGPPLPSP